MPEAKFEKIVSVSSEDKQFRASNLLGTAGSGKWKSAVAGEKQISVILKLTKPSKISKIHVGNEGTAFVEVLVGKESATSSEKGSDWKVLLVASSLMSPADARSNSNLHKVRMFDSENLTKSALSEEWDKVKVVCTQPFNKSQPYGLSFISLFTDGDDAEEVSPKPRASHKMGSYSLIEDTDSDDAGKAVGGSVFAERARLQANIPPSTAAAAVRAAAREADIKVGVKKENTARKSPAASADKSNGHKKRPASTELADAPKAKADRSPAHKTKESKGVKPKETVGTKAKEPAEAKAKESAEAEAKADAPEVAFKELLKGVVFSLSGFKNPKRSDLREKAVEMGARFTPNWDKKCTHLVCAYTNTPKFSQVDGKGYIVTEDWVLQCHQRKKKLPWRDFRLGRAKSPAHAKEDDEMDAKLAAPPAAVQSTDIDDSTDIDSGDEAAPQQDQLVATQVDSDATEVDSIDTDDEISAHLAAGDVSSKGKQPARGGSAVVKQSSASPAKTVKRPLPVLPDYLLDKVFFLYGNVKRRRDVYRYIHAYGGHVEEYMCDQVSYVITDDSWDDNFDSALGDNDSLKFVKSKWITEIHVQQRFIPYQKFAIVPS